MDKIKVKNIFAAVFVKTVIDGLLAVLDPKAVKFWGTEGTANYVKAKGFEGESVVKGFDFDGRVKSLDRANFVRILADTLNQAHVDELDKEGLEPINLVIVDLYAPDPTIFPESMDVGGQSLIRSAIKNYKSVALAFDSESISELVKELKHNEGFTTLDFRKIQAKKAAKFIATRTKLEAELFEKLT